MPAKSGLWKKLRTAFRWCRFAVWFALLAFICAFLWLNRVGLPEFLKKPLVETLRGRGIDLQFTRMRLHVFSGIVAENVRVGGANMTNNPSLSFAQVQLPVNLGALVRGKLEIDGLVLRRGELVWPLSATNALAIENIQTVVRFQPDETWALDRFTAKFAGVKFALSGEIAHAPELRGIFEVKKPMTPGALQERLQKFSGWLAQIHFDGEPQIIFDVKGDARDAGSFGARLTVNAPGAQTPWGAGHGIQLVARCAASGVSTNIARPWDWWTNSQSAVELSGVLRLTNGTAFGVPVDSVQTHFYHSNLVWELPDLQITQGGTMLTADGDENDGTKDFHAHVRGKFDPETLRPLLTTTNAIRAVEELSFPEPITLDVNVLGRAGDFGSLGADGFVALTNFAIRGQVAESVTASFIYTNEVLTFFHPVMFREHGSQTMTADTVTLNFPARLILFTNGFSTADPVSFIRTIGPKTARLVEPYIQFSAPPTVHVEGQVPLRDINTGQDMKDADLSFEVLRGAPYQVKNFRTRNVTGNVRWRAQSLMLTNVAAEFYGGACDGWATFDFRPTHYAADYQFGFDLTNVDIQRFLADVERTNNLDGILSGRLVVTKGSTDGLMTWNGYGHVNLRDGLIWDEPVFGFLSPVLNTVYAGLGNSRATDAQAWFVLTNGVFFTDSMEIRSTMVRLAYSGTVDMDQNLNAHVNGQLLRDVWGVGPLVSTVLWPMSKLFEYKISGTLKNPKSDPVYVPKILLLPLHPIRTIEGILPGGDFFTNSPPEE